MLYVTYNILDFLTLFFFIRIIFSLYKNFVNYESSFLNQKYSNTRIDTNDEKSSNYPNSHKVPKKSHIPK